MECDGRQQFTQLVMDQLIEQTINFNFKVELSGWCVCGATGPDVHSHRCFRPFLTFSPAIEKENRHLKTYNQV